MNLEQLKQLFPTERREEVASLFESYVDMGGSMSEDDVEGFALFLHAEGVLSTAAMKDVLTLSEVSLTMAPAADVLPPNRYRLLGLLGKGNMGEVHAARDPHLERTVAVKRIDEALLARPSALHRFWTEAQITAQLDHPGIVPIYGLESAADGRVGYAMKLVRGRTLTAYMNEIRARLNRGEELAEDQRLAARIDLFLPILNAVGYAHQRAILHRDLKPDNIMVGAFGEVLVMDWGLARPIGKRERVTNVTSDSADLTLDGSLIGTPAYMSPEQALGGTETLGAASDQYALGLILYELVSLRRAVTAPTAVGVISKAAVGDKHPLESPPNEPIARELRAIIDKATAVPIADRYPSLDVFADDLHRYLRDASVMADPDGPLRRVKRWVGHHRGASMLIVVGLVLAAIAGVLVVMQLERNAAGEREAKLEALTGAVAAQTLDINLRLVRYEAMLQGMVSATETALSYPAPDAPELIIYQYKGGKRVPATIPPYAIPSKRYEQPVSFRFPDVSAPPSADPASLRPRAQQLWQLAGSLRRLLLESHSPQAMTLPLAQAERLVLDEGTPLAWSYVASSEGVLVNIPGSWDDTGSQDDPEGGYDYDVRELPWYQLALATRGPVWSSAGADITPAGRMVSCVQAVYSEDGALLAVAGIDMSFGYFIDQLLEHPTLAAAGAEALLVGDDDGRVVVRSSQKEDAKKAAKYAPAAYEDAAVLAAIKARGTGRLALPDGRLAIWSHLTSVPWTYLIVGAADALLTPTL